MPSRGSSRRQANRLPPPGAAWTQPYSATRSTSSAVSAMRAGLLTCGQPRSSLTNRLASRADGFLRRERFVLVCGNRVGGEADIDCPDVLIWPVSGAVLLRVELHRHAGPQVAELGIHQSRLMKEVLLAVRPDNEPELSSRIDAIDYTA